MARAAALLVLLLVAQISLSRSFQYDDEEDEEEFVSLNQAQRSATPKDDTPHEAPAPPKPRPSRLQIEHSLIVEPTRKFVERQAIGVKDVQVVTVEGAEETGSFPLSLGEGFLTGEERMQFQKLVDDDAFYQVRLSFAGRSGSVVASISARKLLTGGFREKFRLVMDHSSNLISVGYTTIEHWREAKKVGEEVKFTSAVTASMPSEAPAPMKVDPPKGSPQYQEQQQAAKEAGVDGEEENPPEEQSFLRKYWMYLIPVALLVMGGGAEPPPQQGGARGQAQRGR